MYPIAWAVVEKETNEAWDWFCALLFKDLAASGGDGWVIISDQQKGSLAAMLLLASTIKPIVLMVIWPPATQCKIT
ncbi:hypothetical protein E2562_001971 [Oryza meyeriana var. granulata]|uniref:MULE transposase domain-containing protein n=1 Tax=Oryza meyeriana var. granulata TaxID=110450 RepID=A0A6G1C2J5_9ORYZ|nr:hypothetical protein E2562_001971 [Oryza meyeriana var. granulata]